ncbi:MAG: acyl-CoA dehydrogenase [Cyanobacteria bacterium QH_8_48_120]|jgi:alkylation response protein AidB-like acyl-CoA dehydrogenase|nr:MAG: acyl-CoA dehydrogenase [Cyanobacteria bacterium QH_1_48_107]PSO58205.1 MAG: acyl-CoA dehydrogenase [Cyanobacteria bacterium QH_10_48_56]PSO62140.1 MAG: acyl-CoA dehydrogenase [Cyanobacteria bacterium QH_7_48_89]PSO63598.1 MAG: acyl-CoA dehydrogenase [Cyanobacteria bacterium QH_6_48_35]PSO70387.1 MAG: acyl-CoA dehydrogenase [Cyanobacteria bacterium QS_1_48_34]PSO70974.1 MAG: acyl-CoA dehydrogenase [Cyanobacteria bacterium QH_3_48_40]PSO75506.1 MAG: acyl-CoA dehydrogenase [Cyanobacteria
MIDFSLTPEQQTLQKKAREFAQSEIAPIANKIDSSNDSKLVPWEFCKDMFGKGTELGFTSLLLPQEYGGWGKKCIDLTLVLEELGVADVSIAASYFNLTAAMSLLIAKTGTEEQRKRILSHVSSGEPHLFSAAESEPGVASSDFFCPKPDPNIGMKTFAKRDGDAYLINGNKAALITNSGVADAYFIMARTALDQPMQESTSMFYVPADTPGLSFGDKTEIIGWKASHHAALYLDNVRVPAENLLGQEGQAGELLMVLPEVAIGLAASFVGLARAAYEYALDYAKQRVSWGSPLIEHQAVALKLADMMVDTQSARLMVWDAAHAAEDNPQFAATVKAPAAKTFAVDVAIKNAQKAVEILGGYGVTKESQAGKFLNDAWIGYSCDFARDMLRLGLVNSM